MTELLLKLFVKDYKNTKDQKVRKKYGLLGSFFGLITNFLLFIAKITVGIILNIYSIIADSVNNLSDFGNNFLSIFGFKIAAKQADADHPFGHQRMEYVISLVISCVILALGVVMMYQGILDLVAFIESIQATGKPVIDSTFTGPNGYTVYVVTLSILAFAIFVKILQALLYFSLGKKIDSMQLSALGKDSLNDVISTSLVIVGVIITYFTGFTVDCFFTIAVAILVIVSGIGIMKGAINILIGQKPDQDLINKLITLVMSHKRALGMHDLTMHYYGNVIFAVIHVEVDARADVIMSHELCDEIEKEVYAKLGINLTVHMDPVYINDPDTNKYKSCVEEALKSYKVKVTMHDFRILSAPSYVNVIFDLVMPPEVDNIQGQQEIREHIQKYTNNKYGKPTYLIINFDNEITDFLAGTIAERKDQ
ncbi:MAG: cation diffusion facilitator family transporter [Bacilli bacterium]